MIAKLQAWAAAAIIGSLLLSATHGFAYLKGRSDIAAEHKLESAQNTIDIGRVNLETQRAVASATAELHRQNQALQQDLDYARNAIRSFNEPPAEGRVGPDAMVDPTFVRLVLLCHQRLRRDPNADGCAAAAADGDAGN